MRLEVGPAVRECATVALRYLIRESRVLRFDLDLDDR